MKVFRTLIKSVMDNELPDEPNIFDKGESVELLEVKISDDYFSGIGVKVANETYEEWICASFFSVLDDEE